MFFNNSKHRLHPIYLNYFWMSGKANPKHSIRYRGNNKPLVKFANGIARSDVNEVATRRLFPVPSREDLGFTAARRPAPKRLPYENNKRSNVFFWP